MIVVVSDTSPIRALSNIDQLSILGELYGQVIVPPAVDRELRNPPRGQATIDLTALSFVCIMAVADLSMIKERSEELDPGESEALALALEIQADLVLIDENAGRSVARRLGLATIGVLGILLEAKHRGLVDAIASMLDRLKDDYGFFLASRLRTEVLRQAGEVP